MRAPRAGTAAGLAVGLAVGSAVLGLTGCAGSKPGTTHSDPDKVKSITSQLEFGDTVNYGAFGTSTEVDCAAGKSLNLTGSNNTLKVKGRCAAVRVSGADNRVTLDEVSDSLTITGLNNAVSYRAGEPTVDDRGSGNTIRRR